MKRRRSLEHTYPHYLTDIQLIKRLPALTLVLFSFLGYLFPFLGDWYLSFLELYVLISMYERLHLLLQLHKNEYPPMMHQHTIVVRARSIDSLTQFLENLLHHERHHLYHITILTDYSLELKRVMTTFNPHFQSIQTQVRLRDGIYTFCSSETRPSVQWMEALDCKYKPRTLFVPCLMNMRSSFRETVVDLFQLTNVFQSEIVGVSGDLVGRFCECHWLEQVQLYSLGLANIERVPVLIGCTRTETGYKREMDQLVVFMQHTLWHWQRVMVSRNKFGPMQTRVAPIVFERLMYVYKSYFWCFLLPHYPIFLVQRFGLVHLWIIVPLGVEMILYRRLKKALTMQDLEKGKSVHLQNSQSDTFSQLMMQLLIEFLHSAVE
ncbi:hypothetical protein EDD86DRAFT_208863 [Gorgonomyces haynaldii]|nr:hypothetical protein EDD86DRAFT_208863 [Gorgonomyces haynaldii]